MVKRRRGLRVITHDLEEVVRSAAFSAPGSDTSDEDVSEIGFLAIDIDENARESNKESWDVNIQLLELVE